MARIPEEEIQHLKQEISLERLCERYGIELKRQGKHLVGHCPWHQDNTPSFIVTPENNLWHCMGACDDGGDVFSLVMKAEKVSFRRAADMLRELRGDAPPAARHTPLVTPEQLPADPALLRQVADFYHHTFTQEPQARQYLEQRCCLHPDAVAQFRIGYANRTVGYRLPPKDSAAGKTARSALQRVGILRASGHEHLNGSVVFPIHDLSGQPVQLYGRKITPHLRKGTPLHLYLPGPLRGVWNLPGLVRQHTWVLCEAILDALTLWCHDIRHVTCCFGTHTFTNELWTLLRQAKPERMLIAFDRDDAGDRAAEKLAPKLAAEGVTVHRVRVPTGTDVNEYVCSLARAKAPAIPQGLRGLLASAPILAKARAGSVPVPDAPPEISSVDRARVPSSLAAKSLAAKEKSESPHPDVSAPRTSPEQQAGERIPDAHPDRPTPPDVSFAAQEASGPPHPNSPKSPCPPVNQAATDQTSLPIPPPAQPSIPRSAAAIEAAVKAAASSGVERRNDGDEIELRIGNRVYRARGLAKNRRLDVLKVTLRVLGPQGFHVDTLDLYNARQRSAFVNLAARELALPPQTLKQEIGRVLLTLEAEQDAQLRSHEEAPPEPAAMSTYERTKALDLLKSPNLLERILQDFESTGLVGERTNKLVGYLAAVSRKLDKPLAIVIQSSSASGKTALMEAILAMMPEEERVQYSAMTGQSLFYLGEQDLKYKILAIVEEEGARHASYALKLLQSEGKLIIASTTKDAVTGQLVTKEYHVEGPVMLLITTTDIEIDEELLNRCLILTIDESRDQTRAIHARQRQADTLDGLKDLLQRQDTLAIQRHAQRLLQPVHVVNPYATALTFLDSQTRTRRDHQKYLTLIRTLAFLHQYQRPLKTFLHQGRMVPYIEVTLDDIAMANRLASEVLGRTLDELAPQTRRFLELISAMVQERCERLGLEQQDCRFTQRQIRTATGWSDNQVKTHLRKLVSLEYVLVHRGGRGQQFVYELLYHGEGRDGRPFLMGLLDVDDLRRRETPYDVDRVHEKQDRVPTGCPQGGPKVAPRCMPKITPARPARGRSQTHQSENLKHEQGGAISP